MRYHLEQIGIGHSDTPQGWNFNDERQGVWEQEKKKYGFDSRETWSLDYSFKIWLFERLSMFNEVNIVNTTFHKFEYKEEILTLQQCIDKIIEGLKLELKSINDLDYILSDDDKSLIKDVIPLFALIVEYLWW